MVSSRLRKYAPLLRWMLRGKRSVVKAIINESDRDVINVFCECAHNIVNGNATLNPSQRRQLKRHKRSILLLLNRSASLRKKKKALQTGGFVGALLGAVLPAIIAAATGAAV